MSSTSNKNLPQEILQVLPNDPFEQLEVACKITSIALSTRVNNLETESHDLRQLIADRDADIVDLSSKVDFLDTSLSQELDKLSLADQEKENLLRENALLLETVNKLKRDVAKLETFRKTLMRSLQDEDENLGTGQLVDTVNAQNHTSLSSQTYSEECEESTSSQAYHDEPMTYATRPRISESLWFASQTSTPRLTPTGSPSTLSASASPTRTPTPVSPRRHSTSVASTRGTFDDKPSVFSSGNSSPYASMSGRRRVDGKEFFRQVRTRLSYEQFAAFLANVKELNSQKQSKEDTLQKADEILGADNKDLYAIFEGLITRNFS